MKASEASQISNLKLKPDILSYYNKCMAHINLYSYRGEKECLIVLPRKIVNEVCSLLVSDGYRISFEEMPSNIVLFPGNEEESLIKIIWRGA